MNKIATWILALAPLFGGCSSNSGLLAPLRGTVTYSVADDRPVITAAKTPFDADAGDRDAYLFWFRRGFEDAMEEHVKVISWEPGRKGDAGASGYAHGLEEGAAFRAKRSAAKR